MALLMKRLHPEISKYRDRRFSGSQEDFDHCLRTSTTLYIGNLSFYTTEEQIWELFSLAGDVKRIVMGLDSQKRTPCGFCFVIYYTRADAEAAVKYVNGTKLDDRLIRVDFDWGFQEGRQFGRGRSGGQVRDEYRLDYDPGRGGYGKQIQEQFHQQHNMAQMAMYAEGQDADQPAEEDQEQGPAAKRVRRDAGDEGPRGARYRESDDED